MFKEAPSVWSVVVRFAKANRIARPGELDHARKKEAENLKIRLGVKPKPR